MRAHRPLLPCRGNALKVSTDSSKPLDKKKTNDNTVFLIFEDYISIKKTKIILNNILGRNSSRTLLFENQ